MPGIPAPDAAREVASAYTTSRVRPDVPVNDQSDDDGDLKNRPKAAPAAMKGADITPPPATPSTQPKPPPR